MIVFKIKPNEILSGDPKYSFPVSLLPIAITPLYTFSNEHYALNEISTLGERFLTEILLTLMPYKDAILAFTAAKECGVGFWLDFLYIDSDGVEEKDRFFSLKICDFMDANFFSTLELICIDGKNIFGSKETWIHNYFFSLTDIFTFRAALQQENLTLKRKRFIAIEHAYFKKTYLSEAEKSMCIEETGR